MIGWGPFASTGTNREPRLFIAGSDSWMAPGSSLKGHPADTGCKLRDQREGDVSRMPNHDVAPDRAAILVLRDTMPLQAARQVNAIVRPYKRCFFRTVSRWKSSSASVKATASVLRCWGRLAPRLRRTGIALSSTRRSASTWGRFADTVRW